MTNKAFVALVLLATTSLVVGCREKTQEGIARNDAPAVKPGQVDAAELAEYLGVSVWSFEYSGKLARIWVEIDAEGKKILVPDRPEDHPNLKLPPSGDHPEKGKVNLWVKKGEIALKVSGAYPGGYATGFGADELWWGWPSRCSSWSEQTVKPRPGEEVTLLQYVVTNSQDSARKVTLLLKAKFAGEER